MPLPNRLRRLRADADADLPELTPYWTTADGVAVRYYLGDALRVLRCLPPRSVQAVVTSPPYWGQRAYLHDGHDRKHLEIGTEPSPDCGSRGQSQCGACYVCGIVAAFREVRRVLREDGTLWLNLGDTYGSGGDVNERYFGPSFATDRQGESAAAWPKGGQGGKSGLPPGNLVGVPWRVAFALQQDGWVLRQDIVWSKPAPMPESVANRCTKSHEYIFLFAKATDYYYDTEAIKTPTVGERRAKTSSRGYMHASVLKGRALSGNQGHGRPLPFGATSNRRSVWSVDDATALRDWLAERYPDALQEFLGEIACLTDVWRVGGNGGYPGVHYATYPPALIEPAVLAATAAQGCCGACGSPRQRIVETVGLRRPRPNSLTKRSGVEGTGSYCPNDVAGVATRTVGWEPTCRCNAAFVPCTVLDPFVGSGTTAEVCVRSGRRCIGIDLSEAYLRDHAVPRLEEVLRGDLGTVALLPARVIEAPDCRVALGGRSAGRGRGRSGS